MNISELIKQNEQLIQVKKTSDPDLFVIKYRNKVFYADLWNDFLRECRGLIIDTKNNIVAYPFTKIHNFRREKDAPSWSNDQEVDYVRKINGFMVAITSYNGKMLVSTTGSIDSDFAKLARSHVSAKLENFILQPENKDFTFMFECCDPSDPHIIDETPGLYFLGCREKKFGSKILYTPSHEYWENLGVHLIPVESGSVGDVEKLVKFCKHEGYVMYSSDGTATKWKSPYYLTKKLFMRGNLERLLSKNIKNAIDEEYYDLVDAISSVRDNFQHWDEQTRKIWIENYLSK